MNSKGDTGLHEKWSLLRKGYQIISELTPLFLPLSIVLAFISAAQPLLVLFCSARVINELAGERSVAIIACFAALAVCVSFILSLLKGYLTQLVSINNDEMAYTRVKAMEAEQFARMDFSFTEDPLIAKMLADMDVKMRGNGLGIMNLYYRTIPFFEHFFSLLLSIIMLIGISGANQVSIHNFITSPYSVVMVFALMLAMIVISLYSRTKEKDVMERMFADNMSANNAANYYSAYLKVDKAAKDIRFYKQKKLLLTIFEKSAATGSWRRFFGFEGKLSGLHAAMLSMISGCVYLVIGLRALYGMYPIGDVTRFAGAVMTFSAAVGLLVSTVGEIYINIPYIKPMTDYLALKRPNQSEGILIPKTTEYSFEFRHVSFRYPGSEVNALTDVNLRIISGKRLAVVGLNGSGKTTLIKLLCRLYEPTEGEILMNGINITRFALEVYYRVFSVVFQDFVLFPLTLKCNISVSDSPDINEVSADLMRSGYGEHHTDLAAELNMYVSKAFEDSGTQLSGGEAQKAALARALYKDAPVFVLDEPTAALDPIAEHKVYTSFDQTIGSRTAVFISHRLSSCCFCHQIAVFDQGRVVQYGSHENLLSESEGCYRKLWDAQAGHYV